MKWRDWRSSPKFFVAGTVQEYPRNVKALSHNEKTQICVQYYQYKCRVINGSFCFLFILFLFHFYFYIFCFCVCVVLFCFVYFIFIFILLTGRGRSNGGGICTVYIIHIIAKSYALFLDACLLAHS